MGRAVAAGAITERRKLRAVFAAAPGVVGPLIEVPVLVTLIYVALWDRRYWRRNPDGFRSD